MAVLYLNMRTKDIIKIKKIKKKREGNNLSRLKSSVEKLQALRLWSVGDNPNRRTAFPGRIPLDSAVENVFV